MRHVYVADFLLSTLENPMEDRKGRIVDAHDRTGRDGCLARQADPGTGLSLCARADPARPLPRRLLHRGGGDLLGLRRFANTGPRSLPSPGSRALHRPAAAPRRPRPAGHGARTARPLRSFPSVSKWLLG